MNADALKRRLTERLSESSPLYMLDIMPGWVDLIEGLDRRIAEIDPGYKIHQVKEKFGGLRYYVDTLPEHRESVYELVGWAEGESFHICDACGAGGWLQDAKGWLCTRCPEHCPEGATPIGMEEDYEDID